MINWLAVGPAVLFSIVFFVFPMFRMLQISFYRSIGGAIMEPAFVLDNYMKFFSDPYYIARQFQTVRYGIIVSLLSLILGFPLAYTLVRNSFRGRSLVLGIVLFPILMNAVVLVFSWYVIFGPRGPLNQIIRAISPGADTLRILSSPTAVLIGLIHAALPFSAIPMMAAISNIPPSLEDAATSLGASRFHVLSKIVIPLAMPGILGGGLLAFTSVLSGFLYPLYLGGNTTNIMPLLIYRSVSELADWPFGAAMTYILLVTTLMLMGLIALFSLITRIAQRSNPS